MDDWLMWTGIIIVLKLFLLAFCYCYRAEQRSKINRRLLREDVEIQRSGQTAINFVNNGQDRVYTVPNTNDQQGEFEHVQSFEPPPSNDRFHDPPPSYWATVNNDEHQNQIRPSYFTPTRMN